MSKGTRRTLSERITEKEQMIAAITMRLDSEKKELKELQDKKKKHDLENLNKIIEESGLGMQQISDILQMHITG